MPNFKFDNFNKHYPAAIELNAETRWDIDPAVACAVIVLRKCAVYLDKLSRELGSAALASANKLEQTIAGSDAMHDPMVKKYADKGISEIGHTVDGPFAFAVSVLEEANAHTEAAIVHKRSYDVVEKFVAENNKIASKIACGCGNPMPFEEPVLQEAEPAMVEVEEDPNEMIAKALMEVASALAEDESPMEEMQEEMGIGEEAIANPEEVESAISTLLETMEMDEAEEIADHNMALWRGVHHRLNEMQGITAAAGSRDKPWRLVDGVNKTVGWNMAAIEKALRGPTSIVSLDDADNIDILFRGVNTRGGGGHVDQDEDEIDVQTDHEHHEYKGKEMKQAIKKFLDICEKYKRKNASDKTAAKKENNPYAICTESVGRENEAKYKRCKEDVEKKQGSVIDRIAADFLKK